ncbi:hypothetical protein M9H77_26916 [Catharanthus roseus]|uniref:Uncharacterized protein n=1 Tax=Catharanthus roseus TaxID=4058 RepID=A0ACC0AB19_CATRO|nr:hypothetical protein M9H77_26916 [Catharanthus roseus]
MFCSQISSGRSGAHQTTEVLGKKFLGQISQRGICLCFIFFRLESSVKFFFMLSCKVVDCCFRVVFHCGAYKLVLRGMHMPYSAAVDLVVGLGVSHVEGTLVDGPSRTMSSSSSSSYSLREIVPEREPIPVIDLSDDVSVEGPEMAPVAPEIGLEHR